MEQNAALKEKQSVVDPVEDFLTSDAIKIFDGTNWRNAKEGATFDVVAPGSGKHIAKVASAQPEDVDHAVRQSQRAFSEGEWARMAASDRAVVLHRLADLIDANLEVLAQIECLDVGKPLSNARALDIPMAAQTFRYYADLAVHTRTREPIGVTKMAASRVRHPAGVCAFIIPWNFPFLLAAWGAAPALAAGNTVILKPAEDTPLSTLYLAKLAQSAGVPSGVFQVLPGLGEVAGAALAGHPGIKRMGFTGSPEVGRLVAEACGRNLVPVKLELGGKGAAVVFEDTEVESVANSLVQAITLNAGQVCCTASRWLVHERIWDKFVDAANGAMERVKIGHGLKADTEMGPVVSKKQVNRVLGYLSKAEGEGAKALRKGGQAKVTGFEGGFYLQPALLTGKPNNIAAREEIFGPVAYAMPFKDETEAVTMVNESPYGLANSVWTNDLGRAQRVAESMVAGNSWINAHNVLALGIPYGGVNQSGYGGGVLGPDTLFDYYRMQSVVRPLA